MVCKTEWLMIFLLCIVCSIEGQQLPEPCTDGALRLAGGPNEFEGRVEICFGGEWGLVCASSWLNEEAVVVCRQLGYPSSVVIPSAGNVYGSEDDGPAFITDVDCNKAESTLVNCSHTRINISSGCGRSQAQVTCPDPVCINNNDHLRLVGGDSDIEGRVEICNSRGFRRGVCDTNWDEIDARVACRELGFTDSRPTSTDGLRYHGSIFTNLSCTGDEERLGHCNPASVFNSRCSLAGVMCQSPVSTTSSPNTEFTSQETSTVVTTGSQPSFTETTNSQPSSTPTDSSMSDSTMTESSTTQESAPAGNNTLAVAVAAGIAGGLFLLVILLVVVIVLILVGKKCGRKEVYQTHESNFYAQKDVKTLSVSPIGTELQTQTASKTTRNVSEYEETQKELLNPLYKGTDRSPLDTESEDEQVKYQELEEVRPTTSTRILSTENPHYYSTPTPPILEKPTPGEYSEPRITNTASTDALGYAALESPHLYDDTKDPNAVDPKLPCPYETPSFTFANGVGHKAVKNGLTAIAEVTQEGAQDSHTYEEPTTDISFQEHTVDNTYATLESP